MSGRLNKREKRGAVMRQKHYHDDTDRVVAVGTNETYMVCRPRDYAANPPNGEELRNLTLFQQAARMAANERRDPVRFAYWEARFQAQLKHPEPDAPIVSTRKVSPSRACQARIPPRLSYSPLCVTRKSKALLRATYNSKHPKRAKTAKAALRGLKELAGRQVRELERKLDEGTKEKYKEQLQVYHLILQQQRDTKDKIYSPHKSYTTCIARGKSGRPYEFWNKAG